MLALCYVQYHIELIPLFEQTKQKSFFKVVHFFKDSWIIFLKGQKYETYFSYSLLLIYVLTFNVIYVGNWKYMPLIHRKPLGSVLLNQ